MTFEKLSRRNMLSAFGLSAVALTATCCAAPSASTQPSQAPTGAVPPDPNELSGDVDGFRTQLTLLGTCAGPLFMPGRSGTSSALIVEGHPYLIDAGPGAHRRLAQAGIEPHNLKGVFVTHLHNDHTADLFNIFWLTAASPAYKFNGAVPIYGPGPAGGLPPAYQGKSFPS